MKEGGAVAGVDGCRAGWVVVTVGPEPGEARLELVAEIDVLLGRLAGGALAAAAVDMPIGLPAVGARACDREARALLGPRRSSVFPTPIRALLGAASYPEALALARRIDGKGLSKQAFNLLGKLAELDAAIARHGRCGLAEASPEVAFALMRGAPCEHPKRTAAGRAERLAALDGALAGLAASLGALDPRRAPRGAAPDDVLDACALVWTACRVMRGEARRLGDGARDPRGLLMEVVA
ncbi:MAG: DUF429 domain-containing protein [Acidimicrobiales bacterium]